MRGIFITGTGTDIGKTYVSAALCRALRKESLNLAYYKAAVSGADSIETSDAGYVRDQANIEQETNSLVSFLYKHPLSPHLAARVEYKFPSLSKIKADFEALASKYDYVLVEGAGGIICPVLWEGNAHIMYTDIIKALNLNVIVTADAGLGTINNTVLTINYLNDLNIKVKGVILNRFDENSLMHKDNLYMIEAISKVPVIATLANNARDLVFLKQKAEAYFDECR